MKTTGKVWIIFDAESKTQTKPMSVVQAQVTLLSLAKTPDRYFLWTPGWDEWISLREFLESDQKYFAIVQPPRPPAPGEEMAICPPDTITITQNAPRTNHHDTTYTHVVEGEAPMKEDKFFTGYWNQDFNGDDLDLKKIKKIKPEPTKKVEPKDSAEGADRRRNVRHNFKIEVVLVSKVRSFRSYSRNISLSGTMLEDEIPKDFLNKPFDLIIVNPFEPDPTKARLLFRAKIIGDMTDARRLMFIEQDVEMTVRLDALLKAYVAYQTNIRKSTA